MAHPTLPLVVANWKMALTLRESEQFIRDAGAALDASAKNVAIILCPSFPAIAPVRDLLGQSNVGLGAQDLSWELSGAYTGEVSGEQLKELGCQYVIVGHSERRSHLQESDAMVRSKLHTALQVGLTPILCVGETRDQRLAGQQELIVLRQVRSAFDGLSLDAPIVIAYEPVWMIGTGEPVDPRDAQAMVQVVANELRAQYGDQRHATYLRYLYGGSVTKDNVKPFVRADGIHGVLVGGASHRPNSFTGLIHAVAEK